MSQYKEWCLENNVKVTAPGEIDYPQAFYNLSSPPSFLFYMGEPVWATHTLLSVVGSRSPQTASLNWLDNVLSRFMNENNCAIVSGGARGIDQKAHQVAVRMGRPTVVFLPSGLMNLYPYNLNEWVTPILQAGGAIVSQFSPDAEMRKHYFAERNRLIAALSPVTLVVECKRRSGTLLTAKFVLEMGKKLAVMPTFPGEWGMGGLDLISDGPVVVARDYLDIKLSFDNSTKLVGSKS